PRLCPSSTKPPWHRRGSGFLDLTPRGFLVPFTGGEGGLVRPRWNTAAAQPAATAPPHKPILRRNTRRPTLWILRRHTDGRTRSRVVHGGRRIRRRCGSKLPRRSQISRSTWACRPRRRPPRSDASCLSARRSLQRTSGVLAQRVGLHRANPSGPGAAAPVTA